MYSSYFPYTLHYLLWLCVERRWSYYFINFQQVIIHLWGSPNCVLQHKQDLWMVMQNQNGKELNINPRQQWMILSCQAVVIMIWVWQHWMLVVLVTQTLRHWSLTGLTEVKLIDILLVLKIVFRGVLFSWFQ